MSTDPTNPIDAQTIANYRQAIEDAAQELPTANARALRSGTERVLFALARYDAERAALWEIARAVAHAGLDDNTISSTSQLCFDGIGTASELYVKARRIVGS